MMKVNSQLLFFGFVAFIFSCSNNQEKEYEPQKEQSSEETTLNYEEMGLQYAMGTKAVLGKHLNEAIHQQGPEYAVEFCNTKAYPLTDSMAIVIKANIKRVSDQPRNPLNQANEEELEYIEAFKKLLVHKEPITPIVKESDGEVIGYYPIITNNMCLKCHGIPETDINGPTLEKLNDLYPNDKAKGYGKNELRGIWVVKMDKQ